MKYKGFTIVEITVALFIISLISIISIPLLVNYQKTTKLRGEARALATNLRLAQQLSITEQNIYDVIFYTSTDSYQIVNNKTSEIIKDVDLASGILINDVSNLTNDILQFIPTGAVMESGSITLTNSKNETSTLQIKPSGFIEIIDE